MIRAYTSRLILNEGSCAQHGEWEHRLFLGRDQTSRLASVCLISAKNMVEFYRIDFSGILLKVRIHRLMDSFPIAMNPLPQFYKPDFRFEIGSIRRVATSFLCLLKASFIRSMSLFFFQRHHKVKLTKFCNLQQLHYVNVTDPLRIITKLLSLLTQC